MKTAKRSDQGGQPVTAAMAGLEQASARFSRFQRISWREALGEIVFPAFRLHRYRNVHNRLLLDALCELDCPRNRDRDS